MSQWAGRLGGGGNQYLFIQTKRVIWIVRARSNQQIKQLNTQLQLSQPALAHSPAMEIIQEIIGTRKKQQILNQEAKKTLHKQIKKVTQREISEPPPQKPISNAQLMQTKAEGRLRDESLGYPIGEPHAEQTATNPTAHEAYKNVHDVDPSPCSSSTQRHARADGDESGFPSESTHQVDHSRGGAEGDSHRASAKNTQQPSGNKKQAAPGGASTSSQQKKLQEMRVRKVRSKSPPTNESGKNPAAKIKKYYDGMVPSFTNKKRQHAYYNTSKQGFTYINWDMENELYIFQTQIEQKFRKSAMNKNFAFPRIQPQDHHQSSSFEGQAFKTQKSFNNKLGLVTSPEFANSKPTPHHQQSSKSRRQASKSNTQDMQHSLLTLEKHPISSEGTGALPSNREGSKQKHYAGVEANSRANQHAHGSSMSASKAVASSSSAAINALHTQNTESKIAKTASTYQKSSVKTPGSSSVVNGSMSKTASKGEKDVTSSSLLADATSGGSSLNTYQVSSQPPHPQYSSSKKTDARARESKHSSTVVHSKQLTAMIKGSGTGSQQTHQSTLFSPNQASHPHHHGASGISRKTQKQVVSVTQFNVKSGPNSSSSTVGYNNINTVSSTSQKTYGFQSLKTQTPHVNQSSTVPTTPLPITNSIQLTNASLVGPGATRDQSCRSQREIPLQDSCPPPEQGMREPLEKKQASYLARKNGQQHSVNQRMPKAAPAYCSTQFNNSVNSSQMPSRLTIQTSVDGNLSKDLYKSANMTQERKTLGVAAKSDLSTSQYSSTKRLNDSSTVINNGNLIKFSSEYGTYNTVQLGDDIINRSSDYGGGGADSTDRQSQKTNPMQLSGIVSPDIQIQSLEQESHSQSLGFEPQRLLNCSSGHTTTKASGSKLISMPYGPSKGLADSNSAHPQKGSTRLNQSSAQTMRNSNNLVGQNSSRVSPRNRKRNVRGQVSSNMNKTTSTHDAKKATGSKNGGTAVEQASLKTTHKLYKTMVKPGAISSQSFVQVPDHNYHQPLHNAGSTLKNRGGDQSKPVHQQMHGGRYNSQTPRNHLTSPEHQVSLGKLQKTGETKQESSAQFVGRMAAQGLLQHTPSGKLKQQSALKQTQQQRQASLTSKEATCYGAGKFKTESNLMMATAPLGNTGNPSHTPGLSKMAPSKAFGGGAHDSKQGLKEAANFSPQKQKTVRSRNNEVGKQTVDNGHKSAKWIEDKQSSTHKKITTGEGKLGGNKRANDGTRAKRTQQQHLKQEQFNRLDMDECENFDMRDLDEREPCQTLPSQDFHSTGSVPQKSLKVPLTTRSTHSLALNNLKKQMTYDLNMTSPMQLEDSSRSNPHSHSHQLRNQTHTQPQVKYRNDQAKLHASSQHPQVQSFQTLNPEQYLSRDGVTSGVLPLESSQNQPFSAEAKKNQGATSVGTGLIGGTSATNSTSDLTRKQATHGPAAIKDFFLEEQFIIKEEKPKGHKKSNALQHKATSSTAHRSSKQGQLSLMARDFSMQNYQGYAGKNTGSLVGTGGTTKVLNLPPKPSRNAKNNSLVLGSSTGVPTRSMQSIMLSKVKQVGQQQTMQSTLVMTPKREQFASNSLFKGVSHQPRSKADKISHHQAHTSTAFKSTSSFKEQKTSQNSQQMRYLSKTAEKQAQQLQAAKQGANRSRVAPGHCSPHTVKRLESAKKGVSKVSSQDNLKTGAGLSQSQYSMSLVHTSNAQKMPKTPHVTGLHNTAEKKGAKHFYMSHTHEKQHKGGGSQTRTRHRDSSSVSSDGYQLAMAKGLKKSGQFSVGKPRERELHQASGRGFMGPGQRSVTNNDYEIVFDHLNDDSIPDHPSYDMEEQPTVVLVDDLGHHGQSNGHLNHAASNLSHHHQHHKSKERNASLLNSSALSREQQFSHSYSNQPGHHLMNKSIEPVSSTSSAPNLINKNGANAGRNTVKEPRNATLLSAENTAGTSGGGSKLHQLPKLGSTDSKLFRQSLGNTQQTNHSALGGPTKQGAPAVNASATHSSSQSAIGGTAGSAGVLKDMHSFNKQLSKKQSALKLKQPQASSTTANSGGGASQNQVLMLGGASGQQLPLNKTQSFQVSSVASLHNAANSNGSGGAGTSAKKTSSAKGGQQSNGGTLTHQQRMLETYAKAMGQHHEQKPHYGGENSVGQGQGHGQGPQGHSTTALGKKTTKKSMIKQ